MSEAFAIVNVVHTQIKAIFTLETVAGLVLLVPLPPLSAGYLPRKSILVDDMAGYSVCFIMEPTKAGYKVYIC